MRQLKSHALAATAVMLLVTAAPAALHAAQMTTSQAVTKTARLLSEGQFSKLRDSLEKTGDTRPLSPKPIEALGLTGSDQPLEFRMMSVENSRGIHSLLVCVQDPKIVIFTLKGGDVILYLRTSKEENADFVFVSAITWPRGGLPSTVSKEDALVELNRELEIWARAADAGPSAIMDNGKKAPVSGGHPPSGRPKGHKGH